MADGTQYTIGGVLAALLGWLAKHLWIRARDQGDDSPSVREWRRSQDDIHEALTAAKAGLMRLETLLIEADLPSMKRTIASQGAEIRAMQTTQMEIREEMNDQEREIHARIDRLVRRLEEKAD